MAEFDARERRTYIGGSECMSACGDDPKKPRLTLYLEKTGQISPMDLSQNENIEAGNIMEEPIAKVFHKRYEYKLTVDETLYRHPSYPWMGAHIDRFVTMPDGVRTFLECKNTNYRNAEEWKGDGIPERALYQVHQYMAILNINFCFVGACIGGNRFVYKRINAIQSIIDYIIEREREFWHMVQNKIEPPLERILDEHPELSRRLFPHEKGEDNIELIEIKDIVFRARELSKLLKEMTAEYETCRDKIRAYMKTSPKGHVENHRVYYTSRDTWALDEAKLKKEFPQIYKKCVSKRSNRTLMIRDVKDKPDEQTIDFLDGDFVMLDPFSDRVFN